MSAQLRRCRRGLSEALGQATNHLPEVDYCSATMSGLEPTLYVSCPLPIHYPEMLHTFPLFLAAHNHALTQHRADCGCVRAVGLRISFNYVLYARAS